MKYIIKNNLFALLAFGLAVSTTHAALEFNGVILIGKDYMVSFDDAAIGFKSGWRRPGETAGGYTVISYLAGESTLVIKKGDDVTRVHLKASSVKEGRTSIVCQFQRIGESTVGIIESKLVDGVASVFPLADGRVLKIKATKQADGNISFDTQLASTKQVGKVSSSSVSRTTAVCEPGREIRMQVGDFMLALKP